MIHVHIQFQSGQELDLEVDKDIMISDFMDLAKSIGGLIVRLEFLP
jgi:hypothetical protein